MIKNNKLLKKYNEIWGKVNNIIKKGFDRDPIYNSKDFKNKIKSYEEKVNTNFHNDKVLKECSLCICLSVVLIDFVLKMGKNYYSQVLLEECKHVGKETKMPKYITKNIESSSDESDKEESNEKNSDEKKSNKENY